MYAEQLTAFQTCLEGLEITDAAGAPLDRDQGLALAGGLIGGAPGLVYCVGNGGSAALAAHAANDLVNSARRRAVVLHDPALLTCMANDRGYDQGYAGSLAVMARPGDVLLAISSSGNSANILAAAATVRQAGGQVVTLTGFGADNRLRRLGDVNLWLDAGDYGLVESGHLFLIHLLSRAAARETT